MSVVPESRSSSSRAESTRPLVMRDAPPLFVEVAVNPHPRAELKGIETEADVTRLREMGCKYGQGYFYARPLDAKAAIEFLAEWK